MPSIYDVAREAGVSVGSVSRVLRNAPDVGLATRQKVEAAIAQLDYTPNRSAQNLAARESRSLAIILPDLSNPFFGEMAVGAQRAASESGRVALIYAADDDPEAERHHLRHLMNLRVDGMVIVDSVLEPEEFESLTGTVPSVHVNHRGASARRRVVGTDQRASSGEVIDHLVALGHRRIALLTGRSDATRFRSHSRNVRDGYADALRRHGLLADPALIVEEALSEAGGAAAMTQVLESTQCTAVFASTDLMALGAYSVLTQRGLRVPTDISLVGYDDIRLCPYIGPGLTTVRLPATEIGAAAVSMLVDGNATELVLPTSLVIRASTGPAPLAGEVATDS